MKKSEDRSGTGLKLFLPSLATIEDSYRLEFVHTKPRSTTKWKLFPRQGFVGTEIPQFVAPTVVVPQPERPSDLSLVRKDGASR